MASAAQDRKYLEKKAKVSAKLREKGRQVSFGNYLEPNDAWEDVGSYLEVGKGYVFPLDFDKDFSEDVKASDLMFMVDTETAVDDCTFMVEDSVEYSIEMVKVFMPSTFPIYYEIQVRR